MELELILSHQILQQMEQMLLVEMVALELMHTHHLLLQLQQEQVVITQAEAVALVAVTVASMEHLLED